MKILAMIHGYPPTKNAGAEWYVHSLFKWLVSRGHYVTVRMAVSDLDPYELDGVKVDVDSFKKTKEDMPTVDIIISHLNRAGYALNVAEFHRKPYVFIHHNPNGFIPVKAKNQPEMNDRWAYQIYNAEHIRDAVKYPNPSIVLHPPIEANRVKVPKTGNKITLINLWPNKGGELFAQLARLMPEREFLGVKGGYADREQVTPDLPNMEIMDNTPDIKEAFAKTRILLMPSIRESYGMAGVEAMASGIPVIAHPTPGLKESLGEAGIFCNRDKPQEWIEALLRLDNKDAYKEASAKAKKRFKDLQTQQEQELLAVEEFLEKAIKKQL